MADSIKDLKKKEMEEEKKRFQEERKRLRQIKLDEKIKLREEKLEEKSKKLSLKKKLNERMELLNNILSAYDKVAVGGQVDEFICSITEEGHVVGIYKGHPFRIYENKEGKLLVETLDISKNEKIGIGPDTDFVDMIHVSGQAQIGKNGKIARGTFVAADINATYNTASLIACSVPGHFYPWVHENYLEMKNDLQKIDTLSIKANKQNSPR